MSPQTPQESPITVRFEKAGLAPGASAPLRRHTLMVLDVVLSELGYPKAAVDVLYCSRQRIQQLNSEFRQMDEETDVLSFPAFGDDEELPPADVEFHLGDLAICLPYTAEGAATNGRTVEAETTLMLVHGLLHLLGYDHDNAANKKEMWKLTDQLLKTVEGLPTLTLKLKAGA